MIPCVGLSNDSRRVFWTSEQARDLWFPRVDDMIGTFERLAWLSVAHGVRRVGLFEIFDGIAEVDTLEWAEHGLTNVVTDWHQGLVEVAVGKPHHVVAFVRARRSGDLARADELLGWPTCCRAACHQRDSHLANELEERSAPGFAEWVRGLSIEPTHHLPCSRACTATAEIERQLASIADGEGVGEHIALLHEMREWDVTYGEGRIETPIALIERLDDDWLRGA
jgi:hypothetical protein